jgi:hypothetical protein
MAELDERYGGKDLAPRFERAAREWKTIAIEYADKAKSGPEADRLDYLCRAAMAWLRAARAFSKASLHADQAHVADYADEAVRAYNAAGRAFEACSKGHIERGELVQARGDLEQALLCFELCGNGEAAGRVGRLADRVEHALEHGVLKKGD